MANGNDLTLSDVNAIELGRLTIGGNLAMTAAGAITQSGAITVAGTTSLAAGAANAITLANASNDFTGAVRISTGLDVAITDSDEIDFGISTISGNLEVTANGAITQSGAITVDGTTSLTAGAANDITLTAANQIDGAVQVISGRNVTLNDADSTGVLTLAASTISGNLTVT